MDLLQPRLNGISAEGFKNIGSIIDQGGGQGHVLSIDYSLDYLNTFVLPFYSNTPPPGQIVTVVLDNINLFHI